MSKLKQNFKKDKTIVKIDEEKNAALKDRDLKETENAEASAEEALREAAQNLTSVMEKMRIAEYVQYLNRPWKLLWTNFLIGIARGLGSTIGLAIVLALVFYIFQHIVMLNLPFISDLLTKMVYTIQENLKYFNGTTF